MDLIAAQQRLSQNLQTINGRIARAAKKSGRDAADVTLVAVTKYVDASITRAMVQSGHCVLGESRPQVLWDKADELKDQAIQWHMIGNLQRNKARRTVPYCSLIHSVGSMRLLKTIDAIGGEIDRRVECLLEINISGEAAKHGLAADELEEALEQAAELENVQIKGLMAMASLAGDAEANRNEFAMLRELKNKYSGFSAENIWLHDLSMGMSRDFEAAIEEGATLVRIGSVLFEGVRA